MPERLTIFFQPLQRFLRWWVGELAGMVPAATRKRLASMSDMLVVTFGETEAALTYEAAGTSRALGEIPLREGKSAINGTDYLRREPALRQRVARGNLPICVRLPADKGLRTRIAMPMAVEPNLGQVLHFELDRRTPFAPDTVHFAHRVVGRDVAAGQLQIELTIVPKPVIAQAIARAEALGLKPRTVEVAGEPDQPASGNLLPQQGKAPQRPVTRLIRAGAAMAAVAAAIALYLPVYDAYQSAARLKEEVVEAKKVADRAQNLRDEFAKLSAAERFLVGAKQDNPSVSEVLFELTHILPDDTWVVELGLAAGEVRLSGFTASSSDLIQRIGNSELLSEPRFRSAVTMDAQVHRERFEIAAKIARTAAKVARKPAS
jgi:general secretion pathway protein L